MEIDKIFTYKGKGKLELRFFISFKNSNNVVYFNSLFFHLVSKSDIKNNTNFKFKELSFNKQSENVFVEDIYEIEGVAFYIMLSNNSMIYVFEDIIDINTMDYITSYKLVDRSKDIELYQELLEDIEEFGEKIEISKTVPEYW